MADRRFALVGHTHDGVGSSPIEGSTILATGVTDGYVLTADGAGNAAWEAAAGGGLSNIVEDLTPQLGGDLDANDFDIDLTGGKQVSFVSADGFSTGYIEADNLYGMEYTSNGNTYFYGGIRDFYFRQTSLTSDARIRVYGSDVGEISSYTWDGITVDSGTVNPFTISGATAVKLGNFEFDTDQTVGAGQDDYVLTYDNASGQIGLEAAAGSGGWPVLTYGESLDSRNSADTTDIEMMYLNSGDEVVIGGTGCLGIDLDVLTEVNANLYTYGTVRNYNSLATKYYSTYYSTNDVIHGHLSTTNSVWQDITGYYQFKDGTGFYINDGAQLRIYNSSDQYYMGIKIVSGAESNIDCQFNLNGPITYHTHFTGHTSFKIAGNHLRLYRNFTVGAGGDEFRISADPNASGKIVTFHDKYNDFRAVTWNLGGSTGNVWEFHADYTSFDGYIQIGDGVTAPSSTTGKAKIYVDSADGDLKVIFGDGTVKTITVDT